MGFFSWKTQDTNKSIANRYSSRPTFTVYMVNPLNLEEYYQEDNYEGYGVFGGKDYYELLAEINHAGHDRDTGINLAFHHTEPIEYPVLVENLVEAIQYAGQEPKNCQYQGYFYNWEDKVKRYSVDIYADGSDVELMTRKRLIEFAEEQVCEWYDDIQSQVMDEHGNVISKYAEGYRLADKVVNENYRIKSIAEVEELFKLPAIEIPFEIVYV